MRLLCAVLFIVSLFTANAMAYPKSSLMNRDDVQAFVSHMVKTHHFDEDQLTEWLVEAKTQPDILAAISKPAEKLPWHRYEKIFLTPKRIQAGAAFYQQHYHALKRAEKEYGVPAEIIAAIIGVETFYGQQKGKYRVLDALTTLGFDYPPRQAFFLSELEHFLLLAREEDWDPTHIKGSYAGAMGTPQFIPSSYRKFAIDFDHKGTRDLIDNTNDAIGSVANYFKENGWKTGERVAVRVYPQKAVPSDKLASKMNPKPNLDAKALKTLGITAPKVKSSSFALLEYEGVSKPEYWLGMHNFYVITRYNRSTLYAMAVYQLSQEIKTTYTTNLKQNGKKHA